MINVDDLIELETQVWLALQSGDSAADMEALSEDFLGVYPTGFSDRHDHVNQLRKGPTIADFEICDPHLISISDSHALLAYRAEFRRAGADTEAEEMFVSSLWAHRDGRWVNVFSQDTPKAT